jgi:hypothetical protein
MAAFISSVILDFRDMALDWLRVSRDAKGWTGLPVQPSMVTRL